jgi:RNA polymerase sigma factor (sigma-70 family)
MRNATNASSTDEELVGSYKAGDNGCLGALYERYYKKVYHKCLSFTKNPDIAFDLSQDILLKAFGKINTFKGNSSFSTWLFVITNNHCIAFLRKTKNIYFENLDSYINMQQEEPDFEDRIIYEHKEQILEEQLQQISETERKMLVLKYQHNYSITELQRIFNMKASAVKMRLFRAKYKMGQKLNKLQIPVNYFEEEVSC